MASPAPAVSQETGRVSHHKADGCKSEAINMPEKDYSAVLSRGHMESRRLASSRACLRCKKLPLLKPILCERTFAPEVRRCAMSRTPLQHGQNASPDIRPLFIGLNNHEWPEIFRHPDPCKPVAPRQSISGTIGYYCGPADTVRDANSVP